MPTLVASCWLVLGRVLRIQVDVELSHNRTQRDKNDVLVRDTQRLHNLCTPGELVDFGIQFVVDGLPLYV